MSEDDSKKTSHSLLIRLRVAVADPGDWAEFLRRYEPLIYRWCRRWNLQEADSRDVTQDVLLTLSHRIRTFQYDPARSFRGYAKTVAFYAWRDYLEARTGPGMGGSGDSVVLDQLNSLAARDDFQERIADAFDLELLEVAMDRVQKRVAPQTWQAFRLTAFEGIPAADAASRVGMTVAAAFRVKSKVQAMIREEIRRLEEAQAQ